MPTRIVDVLLAKVFACMIYFGAKQPPEISDTTNEYLVMWGPEKERRRDSDSFQWSLGKGKIR